MIPSQVRGNVHFLNVPKRKNPIKFKRLKDCVRVQAVRNFVVKRLEDEARESRERELQEA